MFLICRTKAHYRIIVWCLLACRQYLSWLASFRWIFSSGCLPISREEARQTCLSSTKQTQLYCSVWRLMELPIESVLPFGLRRIYATFYLFILYTILAETLSKFHFSGSWNLLQNLILVVKYTNIYFKVIFNTYVYHYCANKLFWKVISSFEWDRSEILKFENSKPQNSTTIIFASLFYKITFFQNNGSSCLTVWWNWG